MRKVTGVYRNIGNHRVVSELHEIHRASVEAPGRIGTIVAAPGCIGINQSSPGHNGIYPVHLV